MSTALPHSHELRVLIADSSRMASELLAQALQSSAGINIVGAVPCSPEVISISKELRPDVVILGPRLSGDPGEYFILVRHLFPVRAVILLDVCTRDLVVEAFRAGASGVFSRDEAVVALQKCISSVGLGQVWANSQQLHFVVEELAETSRSRTLQAEIVSQLTKREGEVLRSLADGSSNREIAQELGISEHTVKNYVFHIFEKLGVSSRIELMLAVRQPRYDLSPATQGSEAGGDVVAWLHKAAEEGLPGAAFILGIMHGEGRGVRKDKTKAYRWFRTVEKTPTNIAQASRSYRQKLALELTPAQVSEVERDFSERLRPASANSYPIVSSKVAGT